MATRTIFTREQLNAWLTQEIEKYEDCDGCKLTVQYLLQQVDDTGCNWSGAILNVGPNTNAEHAGPIADAVTAQARALFNLAS